MSAGRIARVPRPANFARDIVVAVSCVVSCLRSVRYNRVSLDNTSPLPSNKERSHTNPIYVPLQELRNNSRTANEV